MLGVMDPIQYIQPNDLIHKLAPSRYMARNGAAHSFSS